MFDAKLRPLIDPPLARGAAWADAAGFSANQITLIGFAIGMMALPALAMEAYGLALAAIFANRFLDGLDGAVARRRGPTRRGGFLDILCDFLFYAAVPFGFALADPSGNALAAACLIFAFVGTGSSFLAFAAHRHAGEIAPSPGKAIPYLGGLTEGSETIALFALCCLWPGYFPVFAYIFAALCWITTAARTYEGWRRLGP